MQRSTEAETVPTFDRMCIVLQALLAIVSLPVLGITMVTPHALPRASNSGKEKGTSPQVREGRVYQTTVDVTCALHCRLLMFVRTQPVMNQASSAQTSKFLLLICTHRSSSTLACLSCITQILEFLLLICTHNTPTGQAPRPPVPHVRAAAVHLQVACPRF